MADWYLAPALRALRDETNRLYPQRSKASDGTIGDAAHAATSSDHNPKPDGRGGLVVDAIDITNDPAHGVDCNFLAQVLTGDPRVKLIIWNKQIWNLAVSPRWRAYTGANTHTRHLHISILAAYRNDVSSWWDRLRVPAKEPTMPDNADLPNIEGPLQFAVLQDSNGVCQGYAIFSTMSGELHGHGPGWRFYGRSEDPTPDDQQ